MCLHKGEDEVLEFSLICGTNTITGTVTEYVTPVDTGPSIGGATVTPTWTVCPIRDDPGEPITTTNAAGEFTLEGLPKKAKIDVTISKEGYDVVTTVYKFAGPTCNENWWFTDTNTVAWGDYMAVNCCAKLRGAV